MVVVTEKTLLLLGHDEQGLKVLSPTQDINGNHGRQQSRSCFVTIKDRSQRTTEALLSFIAAFPIYLQKGIRQHKIPLPVHYLRCGYSSQYNLSEM